MTTHSIPLPTPARRPPAIDNGALGMLIFVLTEIMLFGGLVSAHAIASAGAPPGMWPPPGQPLLPTWETLINSGALLASGVVLFFANRAFAREPAQAGRPILVTLALGAFFVAFQGIEWIGLIREGMTMTTSVYGAFFYLIIGTHGLHAVAALLGMGYVYARLRRGTASRGHFLAATIFWYFVVLAWPVLYVKVYW